MKTDIEDEETVGLPGAVTKIEFQGWQRRSSGKFTICYLVFLRKRRRWAFLNTLQALDLEFSTVRFFSSVFGSVRFANSGTDEKLK